MINFNAIRNVWKRNQLSAYSAAMVAVVLSLTTYTPNATAWGQNGHRIIGQIALKHLTPVAREKVLKLLSGDKLPEVTTWADEMRSNPSEFWQKQSPRWHYISLDQHSDFKPNDYNFPHHTKPKDIYSAILKNITILQSKTATIEDKEFNLRFLTHLVGDLHMPLHVGRSEDRGGNRIKVKFFREEMNLHTLWDTKLIESQNLSYRDFADFIDTENQQELTSILQSGVTDWVNESYKHSQTVYDIGDGNFSYSYVYQHMPLVKSRLLKGGVRLAGILNLIFDPAAVPGINALTEIK